MLQGLILTVAGMGTVYLFLILLVCLMGANARLVRLLEKKGLVVPAGKPHSAAPQGDDMARVAAAIAVARRALGKG